jgi:hypothetical protein
VGSIHGIGPIAQELANALFERWDQLGQRLTLAGCRALEAGQVGRASPHAARWLRGQIDQAREDRDAGRWISGRSCAVMHSHELESFDLSVDPAPQRNMILARSHGAVDPEDCRLEAFLGDPQFLFKSLVQGEHAAGNYW